MGKSRVFELSKLNLGCKRLYFADSERSKAPARVVSIEKSDDDKRGDYMIQLDQTIFHPQGGGQPSDVGTILSKDGVFDVSFVSEVGEVVNHYGSFKSGSFEPGTQVDLQIDAEKRSLYNLIHTAGHLQVVAAQRAGYMPEPLTYAKAYMYPVGSYVEYRGNIAVSEREAAKEKIQAELNKLIAENHKVFFTDGDVRSVTIGEYTCPCGGTNISSTGMLGKVEITRLKKKQKNIRIAYKVFPPNGGCVEAK